MDEESEQDDNEIIKYSGNYGGITQDSKFWEDLEEMGEDELLKSKITNIKIYTGKYQSKDVINGVCFTFKNYFSGETKPCKEHKGSEQFENVKELEIKGDEYLVDFHIRFPNEAEYISEIGFKTSKGNEILVGTKDGEDKTIESNGGENIIVGTFGCVDKKLDAMGVLYINKKEFLKRRCFALFMLNHLTKTDEEFKKGIEKNYQKLGDEFKYIWKTVNLPDAAFSQVIKYCSI